MKISFLLLLFILLAFFICILSSSLTANRIFYEDISLDRLIKYSDYILIAEKAQPFIVYKEIKFQDKKCPPYTKTMYHFKVIKTLFINEGPTLEGKTLTVLPADYDSSLYLHEAYYIKGISKSPIYQSFKSISDIEKDKYTIIFLRKRDDGNYQFRVHGSYLPISQKKLVMKLISSNRQKK